MSIRKCGSGWGRIFSYDALYCRNPLLSLMKFVLVVHRIEPVSKYGVENHQHDAHGPGDRVQHEDTVNCGVVRQNQLNPENPEEAEGNQQHCHRRNAFSRSSDGSRQSVKDAQQPVERTEVVHGLLPVGHNPRIVGEQAHNRVGEKQNQSPGDDGVDDADPQGLVHPLLYPVQLSGAEILSGEGGNRHADAHHRKDVESVDLQVSPEAGHRRCPEAVDAGLYQHVGDGDDRVLDSCRKAHLDNPNAHHLVEADFLQGDLIGFICLQQEAHGEHAGNELAEYRSEGRTGNAHPQEGYQDNIQDDIGDGSDGQIDQRTLGVSHSIQYAGNHVIQHGKNRSRKINFQIDDGFRQDLFRRVHPEEQRPADQNPQDAHDNAQKKGDGDGCMNRFLNTVSILSPQVLRDDNSGTHGGTLGEGDDQENHGSAGSHGCQCISTDEFSHDDGVKGIVKLLQQVSQNQWHGKKENFLENISFRHQMGAA